MMLRTAAARRRGLSLTEVLVALFVMALGLLSLLTLFPLGAMQIGQALKDNRTAQCATQADGFMRSYWRAGATDAAVTDHYDQPLAEALTQAGTGPVLVDPIGVYTYPGNYTPGNYSGQRSWVAANANGIRRRSLAKAVNSQDAALRVCTLLDDLTFTQAGRPEVGPGNPGTIQRQGRYNWAALLRCPTPNNIRQANLSVLVFDGRVPFVNVGNSEAQVNAAVDANGRAVSLSNVPTPSVAGASPLVRLSGWLMDPSGTFYRIVGLTDTSAAQDNSQVTLDLDKPMPTTATSVYLFAGLSEVFVRPPLEPGTAYAPPN